MRIPVIIIRDKWFNQLNVERWESVWCIR
jgi:hypothetical protein